jgi:deoxyribodipyrimidine photo-lyase
MLKHKLTLHLFRRDLRLEDNTSLIHALQNSQEVIPCFIFDDRQILNNPYRSDNALQFMVSSLNELNGNLNSAGGKLYVFNGIAHKVVEHIIITAGIDAVCVNKDYTPFSKTRDEQIELVCKKHNVNFYSFDDALINPPGAVLKDDGKPYTVFTPFLKKAKQLPVKGPIENPFRNYFKKDIPFELPDGFYKSLISSTNPLLYLKGGRTEALILINKLSRLSEYDTIRNIPSIEGTSNLSAHLKFGTVSIREVYWKIASLFGANHTLISELYWRDFFTHIAFHYPEVFGHSFHKKYDAIEWENDSEKFNAWSKGETGFPIVDAGMRQLNTTGWMHNRVRMIVASFLVKDLQIDWRWGEKFFAQKLIDYDPAVNNGNWQWAASTGCDAQPWFRIFNPWLQQIKFDPECIYIKKWIPEVSNLNPEKIHSWFKNTMKVTDYPLPVIDHKSASQQTKEMYNFLNKQ